MSGHTPFRELRKDLEKDGDFQEACQRAKWNAKTMTIRREDYYWQELASILGCPSSRPQDVHVFVQSLLAYPDTSRDQVHTHAKDVIEATREAKRRGDERIEVEKTRFHRFAEWHGWHRFVRICERRAEKAYMRRTMEKT